ncbi:hypothetical protein O6H91_09G059800 [Diphasiastrum complanatum]|uniref:Uncharacterized protein n=1 Tax=Diphasiastrum complanatum TaxID=34168 RepID=A0ACC2CPM8_DIPCM|nr:hypothetical protein O6H91_09G059800 [Diphasiastrum complanatum]
MAVSFRLVLIRLPGLIQIGIILLFRKGLLVSCLLAILDKRHKSFEAQYIGGCEGNLANGPLYLEVNFKLMFILDRSLLSKNPYVIQYRPTGLPVVYKGSTSKGTNDNNKGQDIVIKTDSQNHVLMFDQISWSDVKLPADCKLILGQL